MTNLHDSKIHSTVMRRIHAIHALRSAASGAGIASLLLLLSLYVIGREVWVARVFQNMPNISHLSAALRFFTYAFTHTDLAVQALILLTLAASIWLMREIGKVVLVPLRFAY